MLQCAGPAPSTDWDDGGTSHELSEFVKAVPAQKVTSFNRLIRALLDSSGEERAFTMAFVHRGLILDPQAESVITLEDGAVWLGMTDDASSDLFVRRCYVELFEAREDYIKWHKWERGCQTLFTGTAGVCRDASNALCLGALNYGNCVCPEEISVQASARAMRQLSL